MKNLIKILIFSCLLFSQIGFCITSDEFQLLLGDWLGGSIIVGQYDYRKPQSHQNNQEHEYVLCTPHYFIVEKILGNIFILNEYVANDTPNNFEAKDRTSLSPYSTLYTLFYKDLGTFISVNPEGRIFVWAGKENQLSLVGLDYNGDWLNLDSTDGKYREKSIFEFFNKGKSLLKKGLFDNRITSCSFYEIALSDRFQPDFKEILIKQMAYFTFEFRDFIGMNYNERLDLIRDFLEANTSKNRETCEFITKSFKSMADFSGKWSYEYYDDSKKICDSGIAYAFTMATGVIFIFKSNNKTNGGIVETMKFHFGLEGRFIISPKEKVFLIKDGNRLIRKNSTVDGILYIGHPKDDITNRQIILENKNKNCKIEISSNSIKEYRKEGENWVLQSTMKKVVESENKKTEK